MVTTSPSPTHASTLLRHSPHPALRRLSVEETSQSVVVFGKVSTYYQKQLAQESLMSVLNGRELLNRVIVGEN